MGTEDVPGGGEMPPEEMPPEVAEKMAKMMRAIAAGGDPSIFATEPQNAQFAAEALEFYRKADPEEHIDEAFLKPERVDLAAFRKTVALFDLPAQASPAGLELISPFTEGVKSKVLSRFGEPVALGITVLTHRATDLHRVDTRDSDEVVATVSGLAATLPHANPYYSVVAILDDQTGMIVQALHVSPSERLLNRDGPVRVKAGEVVGNMSLPPPDLGPDLAEGQHTHLTVINPLTLKAHDPLQFMPYLDTVPPVVGNAYVLDDKGLSTTNFAGKKIEVVLPMFDRDNADASNLEIGKIKFKISDDKGRILLQSDIDVRRLVEDAATSKHPISFLDGPALLKHIGGESVPHASQGNPEKVFPYTVTSFRTDANGVSFIPDQREDRFIQVPSDSRQITIQGTVADGYGNSTDFSQTLISQANIGAR